MLSFRLARTFAILRPLRGPQAGRSALNHEFFSTTSPRFESTPFKMPAMSPTMTEGNIASWKVQEGQSFSAGDILLEIETDKAQMDVEAQDDGVLAKIVIPGGSKSVKVGKIIAMLAEQGDDLSAVEVPKEEDRGQNTQKEPESTPNETQTLSSESASKKSGEKVHITGSYTPAVLRLLEEFGIEDPSAITPTGPHRRILKGDVLAYTGSIGKGVPQMLNEILIKKQQLDLTNIKVQKPEKSPAAPPSVSEHIAKQPPELSSLMKVVRLTELLRIQHELSESLSINLPVESLVEKASKLALKDVPAFGLRRKSDADVLFDELVGQSSKTSRPVTPLAGHPHTAKGEAFSTVELAPLFASTITPPTLGKTIIRFEPIGNGKQHPSAGSDVFDALLGVAQVRKDPSLVQDSGSQNVRIRLEFDDVIVGPESAAAYLERLSFHIESPELAAL